MPVSHIIQSWCILTPEFFFKVRSPPATLLDEYPNCQAIAVDYL
ncbi:MAG: hypothetical protein AB1589_38155 [Cyanobacteriota bacterium]